MYRIRIFHKEAQLPTIQDRNEVLRIFYSFRILSESYINYIEVRKKDFSLAWENKDPVLSPGSRGLFDDSGVMPSCIIDDELYYTGWSLREKTPYAHAIGHAIFDDTKNKFIKTSDGPILDKSENIPYLANSAFVIKDRMWFCNGTGWINNNPTYQICCATKINGIWIYDKNFPPIGNKNEMNSRPFVKDGEIYYAKKTVNENYSIFIGDKQILKHSNNHWENKMVCYPYFFEDYMFYNGNDYGKTGIGVLKCN